MTPGLICLVQHRLDASPALSGTGGQKAVPMYVAFGDTPEGMRDVYEKMAYGPLILDWDQKLYFAFAAPPAASRIQPYYFRADIASQRAHPLPAHPGLRGTVVEFASIR